MNTSIGMDMAEISRVEKIVLRTPSFMKKCFSEEERAEFDKKGKGLYQSVAGSFCVKEAFAKALGSGFSSFLVKKDSVTKKIVLNKGGIFPVKTLASEKDKPHNTDNEEFEKIACWPWNIEVLHDGFGRPYINLKGDLKKIADLIDIDVSITHTDITAAAVVLIVFKNAYE